MMKKVIVIGGGAAGMTAALCASGENTQVTVLEAAAKPGRKILASGNGRCNLMNRGTPRYNGDPAFAAEVLRQYGAERVEEWFRRLGLATHTEEDGRVYPACDQAAAVTEVLLGALERNRVRMETECPVTALRHAGSGFELATAKGTLYADRVIAAMGGMAGGRLGHDGSAYSLLERMGHTLIAPRPALTQLMTDKKRVSGLSGLRLPAILTLCEGKRPVEAAAGEVLFADYGVSGICAMQLSRTAGEMLAAGKAPTLYIDLAPMLGLCARVYARVPAEEPFRHVKQAEVLLRERAALLPDGQLLSGLTPKALTAYLRNTADEALARALCAMALPVTAMRGFENAQVTAGGLDTKEFDPRSCESLRVRGLYAAGELLNVDGDCGGFNLLFAFASGMAAGTHAAKA